MSESAGTKKLTADILVQAPKRFPGVRVWKAGVFTGRTLDGSRIVSAGLKGSADVSGISPIDAPGGKGRRIEIEVKFGKDRMHGRQPAFREMILDAGGIHVIARELEQAMRDLGEQL